MIVTVGALEPGFVGLVEKDASMWIIIPLTPETLAGIHESNLSDALLLFSSSETQLREKVKGMFPEFREGATMARQCGKKKKL